MDANPEIAYLRERLDELWTTVYEKGNPTAAKVAELQGWREVIGKTIDRLDERLFALALDGANPRIAQLEHRLDTLYKLLADRGLPGAAGASIGAADPASSRSPGETGER